MLKRLSQYFTPCLHPQRVFNRYSNEWITTGCGHCVACEKAKTTKQVSMINNMAQNSASVYFITLTFAPAHLPIAELSLDDNLVSGYVHCQKAQSVITQRKPILKKETRYFNYDTSFKDDDVFCFSAADFEFYQKGMPCINSSSYLGCGKFGVLQKSYAIGFIKRIRNLIYAFSSSDFKYYLVGEYGSRSLRPHYHVILFFGDSVPQQQVDYLVSQCWKFGNYDVQRVTTSVADYVASYVSAASALPKFLQSKSIRPFRLHSNFSTYSFSTEEEKQKLLALYREDSPYIVKKTANGLDLFPLPASLRLYTYPKPARFRELSDSEAISILSRFEREAEKQRTLNPVFETLVRVPRETDEWFHHVEPDVQDVITQRLTLSQLKDLSLNFFSKSSNRKVYGYELVERSSYTDVYTSYKVFKLALTCGCSSEDIARHIIRFYRGDAVHPLNFGLSMLNYQYSVLEECDSEKDVAYLYSLFNAPSAEQALEDAHISLSFDNLNDAYQRFVSIVDETFLKSVKHKERNSYLQYSLHHS